MSIDEAIKHIDEVVENTDCQKCRDEHLQLKRWLLKLKKYDNLFDDIFEETEETYKELFEYKNNIRRVPVMQKELKITELKGRIKGLRYALELIAEKKEV